MVDTGLIATQLRKHGHTVDDIITVSNNAGEYEFTVDGELLTLTEVRELLQTDEAP